MNRTVTILQECIPQYRVPFFEGLRTALAGAGVELRLLTGCASGSYAKRMDTLNLPWSIQVPQWNLSIGSHDLVLQFPWKHLRGSDLVIVPAQIRQITSILVWCGNQLGLQRVAFYGHGRDFAKAPDTWSEKFKRALSRRVHWWFTYNGLSTRTVEELGFPAWRITTAMNSIDTIAMLNHSQKILPERLEFLRGQLGLNTKPVAVYVGAMAKVKQIPYLLEAADRIRAIHPGFHLLMVGTGPEEEAYRQATQDRPWIHWTGSAFDEAKVELMMLADVSLLPAWLGLGILDAFTLQLPIVTTDAFSHSVEIDYLIHGENGWQVQGRPSASAYGIAVANLLGQPEELAILRNGCRRSAAFYTIEAMINNFKNGILMALEAPPFPD